MRRDLSFFWRTNVAVGLGAAVAAAVLAGALVVGDSVRTSLRQLTLERLGGVDHAMAGQRFFAEGAVDRLTADPAFAAGGFAQAAPAILLRSNVRHGDTEARASQVGLQGIDGRFLALFGGAGADTDLFAPAEGDAAPLGIFPPVVINQGLADTLGASVGDQVLASLKRWSDVPDGSLLARDDTASVVETLRLEVVRVVTDADLGSFGLQAHQSLPYNAFVPLEAMQDALDQEGSVNAVLVAEAGDGADEDLATAAPRSVALDGLLREALDASDLGLEIRDDGAFLTVESSEYVIKPVLGNAIEAQAEAAGVEAMPLLTYLANGLSSGDRTVPYSTVTALPTPPDPAFGALNLVDGGPAPALGADDILLDAWTAERLGASAGDSVRVDYFVVGPREELTEEFHEFTVAGVVAMDGMAVDGVLTQEYPGIAGSADMSEWDPPFPIDLKAIGDDDETYWDDYRGAPKAFIALETGQRLWRNRWGQLTGVRVAASGSTGPVEPGTLAQGLKDRLDLAAFGLTFQPVKALGLGASGGATDFGGLFVGLSQFVIASAALLVGLLFGLGIEQRAAEIGLRLATGFKPAQVRRLLLGQGFIVAAIGGLLGLAGALGYAALMMHGLRTWWRPAVGTSRLELHVEPATLALGYAITLAVVLVVIVLTLRRVGRVPTPQLLKGSVAVAKSPRSGRWPKIIAAVALAGAGGALGLAAAQGKLDDPMLFGIAGPCLLVGLLALFAITLDRPQANALASPGLGAMTRMALANGRRHRGRSLLSVTLVACATFLVVTVAAYEQGFSSGDLGRSSGAGGYRLIAEADVPLQGNLGSADGRFDLGIPPDAEALLKDANFMPMRLLPGDDTSCLNLYQPGKPRLLGVPAAQIERGGFTFQKTSREVDNPWTLLNEDLGESVIPAIGDFNSTQWILKLPLGEDLVMENERGEAIRVRLVASLATSVFQSELLISEAQFLHHFPSRGGYPYFLVDTPAGTEGEVSAALEKGLASYGFDAVTAVEKLESFHAVQNTYLSTFRSLGGLGLLLGTIGLAVVLIRNVIERRGELAALRAFGFKRRTLLRLVVGENAALLFA
ncbi:MAG: FtsX-like permease family protein, partial [Acidobacteriota bacterium]